MKMAKLQHRRPKADELCKHLEGGEPQDLYSFGFPKQVCPRSARRAPTTQQLGLTYPRKAVLCLAEDTSNHWAMCESNLMCLCLFKSIQMECNSLSVPQSKTGAIVKCSLAGDLEDILLLVIGWDCLASTRCSVEITHLNSVKSISRLVFLSRFYVSWTSSL